MKKDMKTAIRESLSRFCVPGSTRGRLLAASLMCVAMPSLVSAQTLLHRYSFVSDASDSVGGPQWAGTVVPPNGGSAATISDGLTLPGGGGPGFSGYVTLPAGILTNTANITVESWVSQSTQSGVNWAEIYSFNNGTGSYFSLIADNNANNNHLSTAFRLNNSEADAVAGFQLPVGGQQYIAVTFNTNTLVGNLYTNGAIVASVTAPNIGFTPGLLGGSGGTLNNFIGQDPWPDPQFQGTVYEFRIWNGVVSQRYLSASAVAGPSILINNLTPSTVAINAGASLPVSGSEQADVTVQLPQTGSANLEAVLDATNWVSSNPGVLTVNSQGVISAVGVGTATISAKVGGVTGTSGTITVGQIALLHRYSFVADASDSVGGPQGNGTVVAATTGTNAVINNGLTLSGGGGPGYSGYVTLPAGILTNTTSVTIEGWVTQANGNTWAQIWNFGNNGNQNTGIIPLPDRDNGNFEVGINPNNNEQDIVSSIHFPTNSQQYVSEVFKSSTLQGSLYVNGALLATHTFPDRTYIPGAIGGAAGTANNVIGQDPYPDPQFQGTINELRIWNGAVSPVYLAISAAAGPGVVVTNLVPTTLSVSVTTSMIGAGTQQATVIGNFKDASSVNVTTGATNWLSSNPSVVTVNSSGFITAVNGGTATVSATVDGVTATSSLITVADTSPVFNQKPVSQSVVVGDSVTFSSQALGGGLNYQWSFGANPINGATNATLTLTNLSLAQSGTYTLTVVNDLGNTNVSVTLAVNQAILQHRYSFVADASDSVGGPQWNGTVVPPTTGTAATISNGLLLPGGGGPGTSGYVTLPAGILTNTRSITVECWASQASQNQWAELWSFNNGTPQYFSFIPYPANNSGNMSMAIRNNNAESDALSGDLFPSGSQQYIAATINANTFVGTLYTNGTPIASVTVPGAAYIPGTYGGASGTANNILGQDPWPDPQFQGTIYEFRIWDGVVSPLYLAISALAGPSVVVTNLTPTSIAITVTNSSMIIGQVQPSTAIANFQNASGVPVTGSVTNWTSSNTAVLTVDGNGNVTAVGSGTATISASLNGYTGTSSTITVPTSGPVITQNPEAAVTLVAGATFNTTIANVGNAPFVYRWYFNNGSTPISTSSSPALSIPNIQAGNAGSYTCLVSNQYGTAPSSALLLTVVTPTAFEQTLLKYAPLSFWPLSETSGTVAYDVIGGINGTYTGGYTLGQPGPTNTFFGASGTSAAFDGTSAYVDVPGAPLNLTNGLTAVVWVNLLAYNGFDGVIGHGDTSWRISVNNSGQFGANDGAPPADATAPNAVAVGSWHMVAYTYSGDTNQQNSGVLYVDGQPVAENWVFANPTGNGYDMWIGGAPDYGTAPGTARLSAAYIADCAVFPYPLSAAQVEGLFNGQYVANPQSLSIARSGANSVLTWSIGALQSATNVKGPWTTVSGAASPNASPYTVPSNTGDTYYRVWVDHP